MCIRDSLREGNDALNVADMIAKGRAWFQKGVM